MPHAQIRILESSNRVGGRIESVDFGNCGRVNLGATWLHGTEGQPLLKLCAENGLLTPHSRSGENGRKKRSVWLQEIGQVASSRVVNDTLRTYGELMSQVESGKYKVQSKRASSIDIVLFSRF